ncbi:MAG: hypothetical protein ACR2KB_14585 [Chitinophagaceae bacterium]
MKFIEFIHNDHFQKHYLKYYIQDENLDPFIDFFWETNFDNLWSIYPDGFEDTLLPNIGYTYFVNLVNPCIISYNKQSFRISKEAFLPRSQKMTCHHVKGNKVFGIKFIVSPILFEKKIKFIEYQNFIYPLSYLIDQKVLSHIRQSTSFENRIKIASNYFTNMIQKNRLQKNPAFISTEIIKYCKTQKKFNLPLQFFSDHFRLSHKTIQRNFATTTGINWDDFGYYDKSHFLKELKKFAGPFFNTIKSM